MVTYPCVEGTDRVGRPRPWKEELEPKDVIGFDYECDGVACTGKGL